MNDDIELPSDWEDEDEQPVRRKRGLKIALISLGVVVALVAAVGIVAGVYLKGLDNAYQKRTVVTLDRDKSDGETEIPEGGTNYLLLGSDKRNPETYPDSNVTGQRSDVMMLIHVPEDGSAVYVMSFPRDLYIDIPGNGKDRVNAALAFGGVSLAVNTVEDYTGVPIDHVAMIDFEGIQGLVDALGGIEVNVSQDFERNGFTFTKGKQEINGEEALTFVRERKLFAEGDFARNRNQQQVLLGIVKKILSRDTLSSPGKISDMVEVISPFLTTDDGLDSSTLVSLGMSMRDIRADDIYFLSIPHGEPITTSGGASVVDTDEDGMDILREALKDDKVGAYYAQYAGKY
jgi:LCP family protein required for cell wall assembly